MNELKWVHNAIATTLEKYAEYIGWQKIDKFHLYSALQNRIRNECFLYFI